jgi:hypothetical protein
MFTVNFTMVFTLRQTAAILVRRAYKVDARSRLATSLLRQSTAYVARRSKVTGMPMERRLLAIAIVLAIFFGVAFAVYGPVAAFAGLKPPSAAAPLVFLSGVLVVKAGHAIAFVLLFELAGSFRRRWLTYAFIWWVMFTLGEIGQAIGFVYSWTDALCGVVAETIYFPLAAFATSRLIGRT